MNQSRPTGSPAATGSPGSSMASNMPSSGETTIVVRIAAVEDDRRREPERRAGLHLALEHADVPQHVVEPAPREPIDVRRNAAAAAELGRDHDLALVLCLDGQQPGAVDVDVEEVEVAVPGLHPLEHRLALHGVGDDVHVRARNEPGGASAGVHVDDDVCEREEHPREVVGELLVRQARRGGRGTSG